MARRPIPYLYVAMPSGLARSNQFTLEEKGLLMVLMEWARPTDDKYVVWPGIDTIAKRCAESTRTIQRILSDMERKGHVQRTRRGGKSSVTVLICMDRYRSDSVSGKLSDLGMSNPPPAPLTPFPADEDHAHPMGVDDDGDDIVDEETDDIKSVNSTLVVGQDAPKSQLGAILPKNVRVVSDRPQKRSKQKKAKAPPTNDRGSSAKPSSAAIAVSQAFAERMRAAYPKYVAPRPFVSSHMMKCAEDLAAMYDLEHLKKYFDLLVGDWTAIRNDKSKWIKNNIPSLHFAFRLAEELMPLALEGSGYTNTSHRVSNMKNKKDPKDMTWDDVR